MDYDFFPQGKILQHL